jgi:carboxymethylenebutenolidase
MYDEAQDAVGQLVHLYVDGAFNRRELIRRVAGHTGSVAAAIAAVGSYGVARADTAVACPADASVPADAPDLNLSDVQFPGDAGVIFGYLAYPKTTDAQVLPGVIVVHENRGLVEHIKDCTRRVARAGFVGLGVDLLSRQGGTQQFTDPVQQANAYGMTTADQRKADLISGIAYIKTLGFVQPDKIGTVGFCAGGGNVWNLVVNVPELAAAAIFYGTPIPPVDQLASIQTPVLGMYAELDRTLTLQTPPVITAMISQQKTFGFRIYQGVGHAFHNDTGPAYDPAAACDAWNQTIAWFNKFLLAPAAQS